MRCLELSLWPVQCRKHTEYNSKGHSKNKKKKKGVERKSQANDDALHGMAIAMWGGKKRKRVLAYAKAYSAVIYAALISDSSESTCLFIHDFIAALS
jgi:hypothetical protein